MSETLQTIVAKTRMQRQQKCEFETQRCADILKTTTLEKNLKILDNITAVVKNNPNIPLIKIIGMHIAKGMPLDKWDKNETYSL